MLAQREPSRARLLLCPQQLLDSVGLALCVACWGRTKLGCGGRAGGVRVTNKSIYSLAAGTRGGFLVQPLPQRLARKGRATTTRRG